MQKNQKTAVALGLIGLVVIAVGGTITAVEKINESCFTAAEFKAKYPDMINQEKSPVALKGQLAKNFGKVTSLPDKVAAQMDQMLVIAAKNDGVVGLLPVNASGCAINKDGSQNADKDSDKATFGVMPKFLFQKFLQQAEGGPAEDTGKGI